MNLSVALIYVGFISLLLIFNNLSLKTLLMVAIIIGNISCALFISDLLGVSSSWLFFWFCPLSSSLPLSSLYPLLAYHSMA